MPLNTGGSGGSPQGHSPSPVCEQAKFLLSHSGDGGDDNDDDIQKLWPYTQFPSTLCQKTLLIKTGSLSVVVVAPCSLFIKTDPLPGRLTGRA